MPTSKNGGSHPSAPPPATMRIAGMTLPVSLVSCIAYTFCSITMVLANKVGRGERLSMRYGHASTFLELTCGAASVAHRLWHQDSRQI